MNKTKISMLIMGLLLPLAASAKIVFDPTNFGVNKIAAVKAVQMEIETVKQTVYDLEQLKTMQVNLKKIGKGVTDSVLADIDKEISNTKKYNESLTDVSKALGGEANYLSSMKTNYVLGGKGNFDDYMKALDNKAKSGDANAARLIKQADVAINNTQDAMKRRTELQKLVAGNEGIMQSAQTTNQYLDLISSQNEDLIALMAENSRELAEKKQKEALDAEKSKKIAEKNRKDSEESKNTLAERWTSKGSISY